MHTQGSFAGGAAIFMDPVFIEYGDVTWNNSFVGAHLLQFGVWNFQELWCR